MFREALLTLIAVSALSRPASALSDFQATSSNPAADSSETPAWELAIQQRHEKLIQINGPGTDAQLRDRLLKMGQEDQEVRGFANGKKASVLAGDMIQKLPETDARLTQELQQIVKASGWPTIALVGIDASNAAMLILTHTSDHAWQRELLPQLETLADTDKIEPSALAFVIDKELVAEGKPQRYGSQFKAVNGGLAMFAVEDPGGLDKLRARALLPPLSVYKETLSKMYGLKPTNNIVTATAPAPK